VVERGDAVVSVADGLAEQKPGCGHPGCEAKEKEGDADHGILGQFKAC
jgi:hypothetical protein